jgi:lysophospholipase
LADPAPLLGTEAAPVPSGAAAEWCLGADGARLRAALFPPEGEVRGSVVLSPGRTEPIEKYYEVAGDLNRRGFVVLVHDWRGQGLSHHALADRTLGHARGWRPFVNDYNRILAAFEARLPKPWIAVGHSMGGCLSLLALAEGAGARFAAMALSAPMLDINTGGVPRGVASVLAWLLTRFGGGGQPVLGETAGLKPPDFASNALTHDQARYDRNEGLVLAHPDLGLGAPTWGWLDFAFAAIARLQVSPAVAKLDLPSLIVTAGEERLVNNAGAEAIAARLPRARLLNIDGAFHELLQEVEPYRARFWDAFDELTANL